MQSEERKKERKKKERKKEKKKKKKIGRHPVFVTSNRCIPIKNTLGLKCSRVLCVRVIHLFSVVFYEVRALHKFDTKRVINETPMKWLSVFNKTTSCSDRDSCILTGYIPPPAPASRGILPAL
jgi:hypothetical protein